jgi:hypothetical protein
MNLELSTEQLNLSVNSTVKLQRNILNYTSRVISPLLSILSSNKFLQKEKD